MINTHNPPFGRLNSHLDRFDVVYAFCLTVAGIIQLSLFDSVRWNSTNWLSYGAAVTAVSIIYILILLHTVFRILIGHRRVDLKDVVFFLLSYVFLVVQFALYYGCIYHFLLPESALARTAPTGEMTAVDFLYYSGVVMTTLGFGDIVPSHTLTKLLSVFQASIGQVLLILGLGAVMAQFASKK